MIHGPDTTQDQHSSQVPDTHHRRGQGRTCVREVGVRSPTGSRDSRRDTDVPTQVGVGAIRLPPEVLTGLRPPPAVPDLVCVGSPDTSSPDYLSAPPAIPTTISTATVLLLLSTGQSLVPYSSESTFEHRLDPVVSSLGVPTTPSVTRLESLGFRGRVPVSRLAQVDRTVGVEFP